MTLRSGFGKYGVAASGAGEWSGIGSSVTNPGTDCDTIYTAGGTETGDYWIKPGGSAAILVQCVSGYTTVMRANGEGASGLETTAAYGLRPLVGGASAKLSNAYIDELLVASSATNPMRFTFTSGVDGRGSTQQNGCSNTRYIHGSARWNTGSRDNLQQWTSSHSSTSYSSRCGTSLNNGGGGEWASNSTPFPFQDGTCAYNGSFADSSPNACSGSGLGDEWCNQSGWSASTGCGTSGWSTVDMTIGG
jgi:hypothetical protein